MNTDRTEDVGTGIPELLLEPERDNRDPRWIFNRYFLLVLRVLLAAVFIYAGLNKINNPLMFADQIKMYNVIGNSAFLYILAIFLPWLEIICGIALVTGIFLRGSSLVLSVLSVVFLAVVVYRTIGIMSTAGVPFAEINFDCGCGFEPTYAWKKIIENTFLVIFSVVVFLSPSHSFILLKSGRGDPD